MHTPRDTEPSLFFSKAKEPKVLIATKETRAGSAARLTCAIASCRAESKLALLTMVRVVQPL